MIARYSRPEMTALWTDESRFRIWLEVETLALEAMVKLGIAPESSLRAVREKGNFQAERVLELEKDLGHDVIAFLTNVAEFVGPEARFLHWGMTSSDLLDTSFALQLTRALDYLVKGIDELLGSIKTLAFTHKHTLCVGRSHGIHAEPTTFGLKLAGFYDELSAQRERLLGTRKELAVGAISGPVGTYAHLSPEVEAHVCKSLGLNPVRISTQVISRDRHAAFFLACAQVAASLERLVLEVRHLQRTEVREVEEPFGKAQKGSSAMPHKKNPILAENISGLARLVRAQASASLENIALWHERDISHSSVERVIAPDITIALDFMLYRVNRLVSGLVVNTDMMQRNLDLTRGLVYSATLLPALAAKGISREDAYRIVQEHAFATWQDVCSNSASTLSLLDRVSADERVNKLLSEAELREIFSLERHTAQVDFIFNRVFGSRYTVMTN